MRAIVFVLLIIQLFVPSFASAEAGSNPATPASEALLSKMPLKKKIGQLLMVGFQGQTLPEGLGETIANVAPGGLIVFGRNISTATQLSELLIEAQKASLRSARVPLLVSTDQEGGNVIRIKTAMPLPSALALGQTTKPELTKAAGLATGRLLKTLGINMNLAPVLDVADPKKLVFIGTRAYGSDPALVGRMGSGFAAGLIAAGVLPTGKHFPGHGGMSEDSHSGTPVKNISLEELHETDLVPFKMVQEQFPNQWAVMLGHVAYPQLDPSGSPATLSKPIVTSLLRGELGFSGLVLTDDIGMSGGGHVKNSGERVLRAIEAGADMIVIAWNKRLQADLVNVVHRAVKKGRIPVARIDASVRRILEAKRLYAIPNLRAPTRERLRLAIENPVFRKIGEAAMTARFSRPLDEREDQFKEFAREKPVLIFSSNDGFAHSFRKSLSGRSTRVFKLDVDRPYDVDKILRANPEAVGVFYVSGYQAARVAAKISEDVAKRMLLVTVEVQGILKNIDDFRYVADVYYRHPQLGRMVAGHYFNQSPTLRQPSSQVQSRASVIKPARSD